jgi:hypothetical protein
MDLFEGAVQVPFEPQRLGVYGLRLRMVIGSLAHRGRSRSGISQEFEGEATVGTDLLPPFHPSCTCVAV